MSDVNLASLHRLWADPIMHILESLPKPLVALTFLLNCSLSFFVNYKNSAEVDIAPAFGEITTA